MKSRFAIFSCLAFCVISGHAQAQLKDENLLTFMPPGFKVATHSVRNNVVFQEWIPANETLEGWSEMVTTQIILGRGDVDGGRYLTTIAQGWLKACPETKPNPISAGTANGYPLWTLMLQCPRLASTGKPETTLFRAIKGKDSFYLVQRSMRATPSRDQLAAMDKYLQTAVVCDTRAPEHPCPVPKGQGLQPVR